MASYCKCGSLMVEGKCTNKKCSNVYVGAYNAVTFFQMELIQKLQAQINDSRDFDFGNMTKKEASDLIDELIVLRDLGD